MNKVVVISPEYIAQKIYVIRSQKVMLDRHLADMYEVRAIAMRQQIKRNIERFPEDFMFQLTDAEVESLLSQNVIPSRRILGGTNPYAFTEQGVAMLSSILNSPKAVDVNIAIIRTFVKMRQILASHQDLARQVEEHDRHITRLYQYIEQILYPPRGKKTKIGYIPFD
ncbi:MAG: ORF6N domain-containing protein [Rhodospirillales bacterium]|nr:ORF6N domain-containing protein [Rhodospirillales bacterium]MCB9965168.1 ORF6N domain-containing protein [Rhodospirillales bacterium]MCB9973187.1 ORF6N domain-containing protein [Rhodospirillales bacterium]MCB9979553.1 ORF6N domain-containing protein [Rhodospirillales bacterium]